MGTVTIATKDFDIYGELDTDTPGEPDSATTYFIGQLNTAAWDAADDDTKSKSLVTATRILDKQSWKGAQTDPITPQPLLWPRTGIVDCDGLKVADTDVPEGIVYGSYELASAILEDAAVQSSNTGGSNVKSARDKVGDLETQRDYFNSTALPNGGLNTGRFPTAVQELVVCFLAGGGLTLVSIQGAQESYFADRTYGYEGEGIP